MKYPFAEDSAGDKIVTVVFVLTLAVVIALLVWWLG